ncbi:MAG TPA: lipase maturation factor family protein, partial [Myxococcota bacterium]|nr:lipase maturation factor family protein [Myxococcota bacterium]
LAAAFTAWLAYLSLSCVGDVFLSFQWDALLLESGVVALFTASREPRLGVWLARALLFKLMVLSGTVKLTSGDPTWRDLSALTFHYWTQPLPWESSWFAAQLPDAVQKGSTLLVFGVELLAPWGMLGTRRVRLGSGALLVSLQLLIAATGNYGFFNLLTLVLCATLLDDRALARFAWLARPARPARWLAARRIAAGALLCASAVVGLERIAPRELFPRPLRAAIALFEPLRSVSAYGLFAVMTQERPEIQIEGSTDGAQWRPYVFRWKPGPLDRRPGFAGPHMPRLDWQMWFAALSSCRDEAWFQAFLVRLLEGSPSVSRLLAENPFPDAPPRLLRTTLARYRFAPFSEWREGAWWTREEVGPYCPTVELEDGHLSLAEP